jgi:DNA-binding transcriptional regulator YhcF (GntR family)
MWVTDPVAFSDDPSLNQIARHVLIVLTKHARDDGTCHPGIRRIASLAGLHRETVTLAIARLEEAGRIAVVRRSRAGNIYDLLPRQRSETTHTPGSSGRSTRTVEAAS